LSAPRDAAKATAEVSDPPLPKVVISAIPPMPRLVPWNPAMTIVLP
tara:strand:+ start:103 stop:240 length:138 start_codon:yes stop_codon:yes gene_type:complete